MNFFGKEVQLISKTQKRIEIEYGSTKWEIGLRQVLLKGKNLDAILNVFSVVFLLELEYLQFFMNLLIYIHLFFQLKYISQLYL